jgi:hypothetical protein
MTDGNPMGGTDAVKEKYQWIRATRSNERKDTESYTGGETTQAGGKRGNKVSKRRRRRGRRYNHEPKK